MVIDQTRLPRRNGAKAQSIFQPSAPEKVANDGKPRSGKTESRIDRGWSDTRPIDTTECSYGI